MRTSMIQNALLAGVIIVAVSACGGGTTAGTPTPAGSTTLDGTAGPSQSPSHGAPKVTQPLDISAIAEEPCKAVTEEQINSLPGNLRKSEPEQVKSSSKSCAWYFEGEQYSLGTIRGGVNMDDDRGLSTIYEAQDSGKLDVFEQVGQIGGYPAVVYGTTAGPSGHCGLAVGLRNDRVYVITAGLNSNHPNAQKPCDPAKKLAAFVVQNLKEAQ